MNKRALITGITGQDGSYLAELLLTKGYDVHGIIRRTSMFNRQRIEDARARALAAKQVYDLPMHHQCFQYRLMYRESVQCLFVYRVKKILPNCRNETTHIFHHHPHSYYSSHPMQMVNCLPAASHT